MEFNASSDSGEIKKIIDLIQKLLGIVQKVNYKVLLGLLFSRTFYLISQNNLISIFYIYFRTSYQKLKYATN